MKIDAVAYDTVIKAKIISKNKVDFDQALEEIHQVSENDRHYDVETGTWTIHNPERYQTIDFVKRALETKKLQMKLL